MLKSLDLAKREGITNPRIIDWNIVATQWEYDEDKKHYVSIEFVFTDDLKWEKHLLTKTTIE